MFQSEETASAKVPRPQVLCLTCSQNIKGQFGLTGHGGDFILHSECDGKRLEDFE